MKIKFIIKPQDILSDEMNMIRGGINPLEATIECTNGRVKCKKDGVIKVTDNPSDIKAIDLI